MYLIGAIAAQGAAGLGDLPAHLPWAWFALIAVFDAGLAVVVVRKRQARHAGTVVAAVRLDLPAARFDTAALRGVGPDTLVLRDGWWVPRSRATAIAARPAGYTWPLHREYMVSRFG